ncbi:MAG: asparagine synthase (glutamine-hydrolyzing) [Rhodospirillaceae bacterium]|nr:asparagine synthase (glutamine-hydrolyzing) [Rhodospirillaceae bacterium]
MCGIAGGMTKAGFRPEDKILLDLQTALRHRGPDGQGLHKSDKVGLVHTRLAIIDPQNGIQPFVSREGVSLVANGEIYNDLDIRRNLPDSAYVTGSDNESILHLYLRYGTGFAKHLHGMYAVALYDPRDESLILARDPFGIKPLYFAETHDGVWFSSEPQALVAAGVIVPVINEQARGELFALQFTASPETAFRGIRRVEPGETLIVRAGRVVDRIWQDPLSHDCQPQVSHTKTFETLWMDSVASHRRSDVPYGVFLSGGVDSAAIMAAMARLEERPVIAYTAGFSGNAVYDEREHAATVANATLADHRTVEISAKDFWTHLPDIAACMDDPVADYAIVPTYLLAKAAAQDVKVVLTGEGGDEIFAGYGRYRASRRPWPFRKAPWSRHVLAGTGALRQAPTEWRNALDSSEDQVETQPWTRLQKAQALDIRHWLPQDLLTKVDRCLMAHGLEGRVPFLDRRFAAFGFSLTDRDKVNGRLGKQIVRQWLAATLPEAQPFSRKRGFSVPVGPWLEQRGDRLGSLVSQQAGVLDCCHPEVVQSLFRSINSKTAFPAWVLLFYALWHQCHILGLDHSGSVFDVLAQN